MRKKTPLYTTSHTCRNCEQDDTILPMDTKIIAGFGMADIYKDGEIFYSADHNLDWDEAKDLLHFERIAVKSPTSDWRFELNLPLRSATYQRQAKNQWVLIEKGLGFA